MTIERHLALVPHDVQHLDVQIVVLHHGDSRDWDGKRVVDEGVFAADAREVPSQALDSLLIVDRVEGERGARPLVGFEALVLHPVGHAGVEHAELATAEASSHAALHDGPDLRVELRFAFPTPDFHPVQPDDVALLPGLGELLAGRREELHLNIGVLTAVFGAGDAAH